MPRAGRATCVNQAGSDWGLLSHVKTGPFWWATCWASWFCDHGLCGPGRISLNVNKKVNQLLLVKEKEELASHPSSAQGDTVWAVFTGVWQKG